MTKKQLLSMVCALSMAGALASPAFAQPTNDGVSETGPGNATQVEVEVEDSFQHNTEFDTDIDDSFNKTAEFDTDIEDSFQHNTEFETEIAVTDSFKKNTEIDIDKTEYETEVEVELKAENGGMLLAGKGSQEKTEIEDSYNDNRSWFSMSKIEDSYNTDNSIDNSVELEASLVQVATGPVGGGHPSTMLASASANENGLLPGEIAKNELDVCSSFNGWSGISNNVQTVGRHLNGGNLNAIAVGQGGGINP